MKMDNSQSSDVFSTFSNASNESPVNDEASSEFLRSAVKQNFTILLKGDVDEAKITAHLSFLFEHCYTCICQDLSSITKVLETEESDRIIYYLEDTISLLGQLASLVRNLIETQVMCSKTMKSLPVAIGNIVLLVFTHCKESEYQYGNQLSKVEKQLKDLFRTCHELQQLYLTIMEKHYIFDFNNMDEIQTLVNVLDLNLNIGGIVLKLSLKCMADHWRAFTMVCEKYSHYLLDQDTHNSCIHCLHDLIMENIDLSLEENQDHKLMLRSVKVANFLIKILIKVCQIFRHSSCKEYHQLIILLCTLKMNSKEFLELKQRNDQFINIFENNITMATDNLINELLVDKDFHQSLYTFDLKKNIFIVPGYVILLTTVIKQTTLREDARQIVDNYCMENVISKMFYIVEHYHLPFCLKFTENNQKYGILEHLVYSGVKLVSFLADRQWAHVERNLRAGIVGGGTVTHFSAHLWVQILRISNSKLRHEHLIFLSKIYLKMYENPLFYSLPQRIYIGSTIERIFSIMSLDEKTRFESENVLDEMNIPLWTELKIFNLPTNLRNQYTKVIATKMKRELRKFLTRKCESQSEMDYFINLLNLTSTCPPNNLDTSLRQDIVLLWSKLCRVDISEDYEWFIRYFAALSSNLEVFTINGCLQNHDLYKIFHIALTMETTTTKLIVTNLLFKLCSHIECPKYIAILKDLVQNTLTCNDEVLTNNLFNNLHYLEGLNQYTFILDTIKSDLRYNVFLENDGNIETIHFVHKCPKSKVVLKKCESNFDFADIDEFFSQETEEEPVCKITKLNSDAGAILDRLENDAELLAKIKEDLSEQHRMRIVSICNKLNEILS